MSSVKKTMDGNMACAHVAYAFTEVAGIYPITPSTTMAEYTDEWSAAGRKNIFDQTVNVVEMQSEAGAAGTVHGALAAGALSTTYTASQGLLLMVPNMYKIAGELLPGVLHVSARTVASHALSIFGDHSDVMACRQTGFALLASNNVQEAMDLGAVSHLSAIKGRVPFLHFFDGFRTSSEIQKIDVLDYDDLAKILDWEALDKFRKNALNPEHPVTRGTAQNPDIFFQAREASNTFYDDLPSVVENYMNEINKLTGRDYRLFNYYGASDAKNIIIAMGSACDTIEETIDYLISKGEKVGLIKVHLYRPFSIEHFISQIPDTVEKIAVLDRTKEPGALGEPLYQDVCTAFYEKEKSPVIIAGRYALSSKDFTPAQVIAVFDNLKSQNPKKHFTVGIVDDVTNLSLEVGKEIDVTPKGTVSCKFWGLGSDGTVGANKNSIKIICDNTDLYGQAYFSYDSKKSGGITISHLRFGKDLIRAPYFVKLADFVACHNPSYVDKYDIVEDLRDGGIFLLNCTWTQEEIKNKLPLKMKKYMFEHDIKFYVIDGTKIASEIGLGNRINSVLQSAFFKLINVIPADDAVKYMKDAIYKTYGKKGEKIVNMNYLAVDEGINGIKQIVLDKSWLEGDSIVADDTDKPDFIKNIVEPINRQQGDTLPVSAFLGREDGTFPQGTSAYEKRGIAVSIPEWQMENCIQCNQCSYICPHATIRPFLMTEEEMKNAPQSYKTKNATGKGLEKYQYRIQVSALDCTGCGNCADVCPSKNKALIMKPAKTQESEIKNWDFAINLKEKENPLDRQSVKGSQFQKPLFEFSGACAGCGETPYAKLVTQLFGERMYLANATGCSSIWGGSAPSTPYTTNDRGQGPAWANSLFEDNAEFGLGMYYGVKKLRESVKLKSEKLLSTSSDQSLKSALKLFIDNFDVSKDTQKISDDLKNALENTKDTSSLVKELLQQSDHFSKKSQWIIGGDGWAYDIGYGGLDHVLASGENVNILVFDTEVYSNTGGQNSKATQIGAIAKLAASGKTLRKKDLGMMAMSYGYVYVAQVGMGANQNQLIKALVEAEAYEGPSIVIAYAPCIAHGIDMGLTLKETKLAVECGYWHLYRYNPILEKEGKNPFVLDSKEPTADLEQFLLAENRYASLKRSKPELAQKLFSIALEDAKRKYNQYKKLAE